jgi:hypothetical protein
MIRRIKSHNLLNGILFSISEFGFTALIIAPFAFYYISHDKFLYAFIAVGIIFNSLSIVAFGLVQYRYREKDIGFPRVFEKSYREQAIKENPHLFLDTTILVVAILMPFALILITLFELIIKNAKRG